MKFEDRYIKPNVQLYENQKENVRQLVQRRRCVISDKCGAGKTLSVLFAFARLKEANLCSNLLVLTPLSAYEKKVWLADSNKFTTLRVIDLEMLTSICDLSSQRLIKMLSSYDIVFGKHTHLKKENTRNIIAAMLKMNKTLFCVDEVHAFRNPTSTLTLALREVSRHSRTFWGVTATSISRKIEDLYNIVNLVYPWYLGPWTMFRDTYCTYMTKTIGYDRVKHKKRQTIETTGLKDPIGLQQKLKPIMITNSSYLDVDYHYEDFELSDEEKSVYRKIAKGIAFDAEDEPENWFQWVMKNPEQETTKAIGAVEKYSSRFIYLQFASDGIINPSNGTYTRENSVKMLRLLERVNTIVAKKQSVLVYFDYLASVEIAEKMIKERIPEAEVLISTGEKKLKSEELTEAKCKRKPHVVLCSRAASESASYYFINNVIFFHIPTVPSTFIQMLGRITRKNTLYKGDLHCYIFRSENIELYKLIVVSVKTRLMEVSSNEHEANLPDDYKDFDTSQECQKYYKKVLLWNN